MSPYRRNILVGITVLGALVALGWMILKFGDRPAHLFATPSMPVTFITDRADGLGEGSNMTFRGVIVGKVNLVKRSEDGKDVKIFAQVDTSPPLPANIHGEITTVSALGGTSSMVLALTGDKPEGNMQSGASLRAQFVGLAMLPPEFADLARELRMTAAQIRESKIVDNLNAELTKFGQVMDSANQLITDPELKGNLKATLTELRSASETINKIAPKINKLSDDASATLSDVRTTVNKTGNNVDTIAKEATDRLQQVSKTLDHFESVAAKIDKGEGTAGQLVNDPKLYQSLVDSSRELNATIIDLKRLVEQWEQEGVSIKLAK